MPKVLVARGIDEKKEYMDGLSRIELLPGLYEDAGIYKCSLKAGECWEPDVYEFGDKIQFFYFFQGTGYIAMDGYANNIVEMAVFIPKFNDVRFVIHARTDMEFLQFVGKMRDYDVQRMSSICLTMPRFRNLKDCWTYEEAFKTNNVKSFMVVEHRFLGRFSLGAVIGNGPCTVGKHMHPNLLQWCYLLPGAKYTYTADEDIMHVSEGDITFIPSGVHHTVEVKEGDVMDYIWFEICVDGYK